MLPQSNSAIRQTQLAILVGSVITVSSTASPQDPSYELIDLSTLAPHENSVGVQVNASGQFILGCWDSLNFGYFWNDDNDDGVVDPNELISLGDLGNGNTQVNGLNDAGVAIGGSRNGDNDTIAYRWTRSGGMQALESLDGITAIAYGINNAGVIVGQARNVPIGQSGSRLHAAMWMPDGSVTDISPVSSSIHTVAIDINEAGMVLGHHQDITSAWVIRDGGVKFLGGGNKLFGVAINEAGNVIGATLAGSDLSACRWIWNGQSYDHVPLPEMSGFYRSQALGMNEAGVIVGSIEDDNDDERAVIWMPGEDPIDLNDFIDPDFGWVLRSAYSINDDGTIIGFGDLDGDPFSAFMLRPEAMVDTDGDGLYDSWETDGLDINEDGITDLDLPALGCDPDFKDLFVEVDIMQNAPFSAQAMQVVIDAFADAPLINPNGQSGIKLHIDWQNADMIAFKEFWSDSFSEDFDIEKQVYFGTQSQRDDPNWEHIKAAKKRVYRYCIVANRFTPSGAMGWGERPGNDFAIALGGINNLEMRVIASTFMHELGHNLNLQHGGADTINYKPNYVSTMNYNFDQIVYSDGNGNDHSPLTHFSNEILDPLDESSLDENAGIVSTEYPDYWVYYGWRPPGEAPRIEWVQLNSAPYDWNHDGEIETGVIVDLNWHGPSDTPSPGQTMNAQNDWDHIILPLGTDGDYQDAMHETIDYTELDEDTFHWYRDNLPPVPANLATLDDLTVLFGEVLDGDLNDLVASDQQKLKLRSQPGFSAVEPDLIRVAVGATTTIEDPASLGLVFEGRLTHPNGQSRLLLKNWTTSQFVQQTQFNLGFTEEQKFVKDIPAADYVRADDGRIEVAVHQFVVAVFSALGFESHIDRIEISVVSE